MHEYQQPIYLVNFSWKYNMDSLYKYFMLLKITDATISINSRTISTIGLLLKFKNQILKFVFKSSHEHSAITEY